MDLEPRTLSNSSTTTFYCWAHGSKEALMHVDVFSMSVNWRMANYFSKPEAQINPSSFTAIYYLNPLNDDNCPVGICPNPGIVGPLLRVARKFSFSFLQWTVV
jgi:hypothetical protein